MDSITGILIGNFEEKDAARERGLALSRKLVRACRTTTIAIHRKDRDTVKKNLLTARNYLREMNETLGKYPEIYYKGPVGQAQQEYAECIITYSILCENKTLEELPTPQQMEVEDSAYLNGLAEAGGELRRHVLDLIREDKPAEGEKYLQIMDNIYSFLIMFDYPDVITANLRRHTDVLRSLNEKTRGDLTHALQQYKFQKLMTNSQEINQI